MPHGFIVHVCLCSGQVWHQYRLVKQDPFCKKKKEKEKKWIRCGWVGVSHFRSVGNPNPLVFLIHPAM